ncbi:chloramphenicol acetyltransferase [Flavobacteriales bacterium 34_180_T64]|nr:chloramphenicol acetyltransferase [Flavobacteriales bacterium 34_180_T64]
MEVIDVNTWKRKQHFEHFSSMADPYFGVTIPFDVTNAHKLSKALNVSFFGVYLHDCMKAINDVDALKLRVENDEIVKYDTIHASATLMRADNTFALSYIRYSTDINEFIHNIDAEKLRILNTNDFYPPENKLDCIHCSALPWVNFTGHKEAVSGNFDTVPKLAFSKTVESKDTLEMNVAIYANHALVDGYDVGMFAEKFQQYLNK